MDCNTSMRANSPFLRLCGIRASSESNSNIWHTSQTSNNAHEQFSVTSLLQDYAMGFTSTGNVANLPSRIRVDAILIMSLGIAKQKLINSLDARARSDAEERLGTLFWGHDQVFSVPLSFVNSCIRRSSALDYVLWYGDTRELQANLVVIRVDEELDRVVEGQYFLATLAATAMVHRGRKKHHIIEGTYGVVTDGLKWTFLYIDKKAEYSFINLNWVDGHKHLIIGLINKIIDQAVTATMSADTEISGSMWVFEWSQMAKTWNSPYSPHSPQYDSAEEDNIHSLQNLDDTTTQQFKPYSILKMEFLTELKDHCKELIRRAFHGERVENKLEQLFQITTEKLKNQQPRKGPDSIAVTKIDPNDLFEMFNLRRELNPPNYWRVAPWEVKEVSTHLATTLEQIKLVVGRAKQNEAAIRLVIDAVFLDILTSIKIGTGQLESGKGKGKRPSTDTITSLKNLQMAVETEISYIFPTHKEGSIVNKLISGRMDYNLWYGQPNEAETNLLVVEAKHKNTLSAGRYQAISYMALIQHARFKAGRAKIPIYGIATDSEDWDFIRMDATGNVDIQQFNWHASNGSQIISLVYKIMREASSLTPVPTHELTRENTVTGRTSLRLMKSDGTPA
ncbi:uncharacterized protein BJX67DRAFT_54710 [Aspergillus lucknowensis]|uniref:Uncharacterized protein n=1 Tax=Aspergillus lucknowensis TaxID=176173 RepID=A0ABR4LUW6_9EURO